MGISYDALIHLIQDKIRNDYDSPNAAGCAVRREMELRGEKPISEDTVSRIYYRSEDSFYLPKRESLLKIAMELGIPVNDEQKLKEYIRKKNTRDVEELLHGYNNLDSSRLLSEFAQLLGKAEQQDMDKKPHENREGSYVRGEKHGKWLPTAAEQNGSYDPTQ